MNDQIQIVMKKARQSLEAAKLLASQNYIDFAASRAYYAMFYTAEALLFLRCKSFSSHSAVIAAYGKEYSKTQDLDPVYHTRLLEVQDYRNQGDYGHGPSVTARQIRDALKWTEEFIEAAELYLKNRD